MIVMNNTNVILIGNGPSALGRKMGSIIDSYSVVVRLNSFVTIGYEDYIGTKTDLWIHNQQEKHFIHSSLDSNTETLILTTKDNPLFTSSIVQDSNNKCRIFSDGHKKVTDITCLINEDISNIYETADRISTGIYAILYLSKNFDEKITIYGFDSFLLNGHYYNKNHSKWPLHDSEKEKEILNYLKKQNKIEFL